MIGSLFLGGGHGADVLDSSACNDPDDDWRSTKLAAIAMNSRPEGRRAWPADGYFDSEAG